MEPASSSGEPSVLDHVQGYWARKRGQSPIYDFLLPLVSIVSATPGRVVSRLTLVPNHVNLRQTLHGAVIASLVDWAGGLAIASHGLEDTGVSISIHVDYIGTAKVGDEVEIEARAEKVGRNIAFTTIRLSKMARDGFDAAMIATASHTKYMTKPKPAIGGASQA